MTYAHSSIVEDQHLLTFSKGKKVTPFEGKKEKYDKKRSCVCLR
jgi:hypothetical protein